MKKLKMIVAICVLALPVAVNAIPISVTFDSPLASFIPNPGVQIEIDNQFASLGLLIWDVENNAAASVGDCGPGSNPHHLYGAIGQGTTFNGCGDTTSSIDFIFVDPTNSSIAAYTTNFSLLVTDSNDTTLTAYDMAGSVLTSIVGSYYNDRVGVSGIGNIYRVNVTTPADPTAYDDIIFESVIASNSVPEPNSLALLGLGVAGLGFAKRRKASKQK